MSPYTEQEWKDKLNEADVFELVPDFDKAQGWNAVQNRLKAPRRRHFLQHYRAYAAVLVFAFLLFLWIGPEKKSSTSVAAFRPQKIQVLREPVGMQDTVIVHEYTSTMMRHPAVEEKSSSSHRTGHITVAINVPQQPIADTPQKETVTVEPDGPPVAVVPVPAMLPVRHYLDIAPVTASDPERDHLAGKERKGFLRSKIARQKAQAHPPLKEELPLRGLFYALDL